MGHHQCFLASLSLNGGTWTENFQGLSGWPVHWPRAAYVMYFPGFQILWLSWPVEYTAMMALEALGLVGVSIAIVWKIRWRLTLAPLIDRVQGCFFIFLK